MRTDDAGVSAAPDPASRPQTGLAVPALLAVVALAGAATMVVELGAVRLLAPWFGTSSSVWTNVIGVVLAALALGYALGARLATGRTPLRSLGVTLLAGALFAAWLPRLAPLAGEAFMPTGVALHGAAALLVWGSLAAATVLFLPAATALGCAGPLAVEVLQRRRGGAAGRAGGHVLAASTLGSLAGTFGTTHLFVPTFGISRTFVFAAAVLGGCGAVVLTAAAKRDREGGGRATLGVFLLGICAGAIAAPGAPRARATSGVQGVELATADSAMQSLRVVERGEGADRMRYLQVNESLDSFQSVWQPEPGLLPPGHYYDQFVLPYAWRAREMGEPPETWDLLVLGLGAGTAVRVLEGVVADSTELRTVGVEIDPVVVELGERWFDLENDGDARVVVGGLDARAALALTDRRFDQIIVDAYANNMEIPPHLASVEAFEEIAERLVDGGWLAINVGGFGAGDPVVRAVAAAAAVGLRTDVHIARVPLSRNLTIFARRGGEVPKPGGSAFGVRGAPLIGDVGRLLPALAVEGGWTTVTVAEAEPLAATDDTTAMEHLQLVSIRSAEMRIAALDRAGNGVSEAALAPPVTPEDADLRDAARELRWSGDLVGAIEAADAITAPGVRATARANLLWAAGDPFGALEIASAGLSVAPGDAVLLGLTVDLALVVGAADLARRRLVDLESLVARAEFPPETRQWWTARIAALDTLAQDAEALRAATHGALARSRAVAILLLLGAALGAFWVSRHPVAGERVGSATA